MYNSYLLVSSIVSFNFYLIDLIATKIYICVQYMQLQVNGYNTIKNIYLWSMHAMMQLLVHSYNTIKNMHIQKYPNNVLLEYFTGYENVTHTPNSLSQGWTQALVLRQESSHQRYIGLSAHFSLVVPQNVYLRTEIGACVIFVNETSH